MKHFSTICQYIEIDEINPFCFIIDWKVLGLWERGRGLLTSKRKSSDGAMRHHLGKYPLPPVASLKFKYPPIGEKAAYVHGSRLWPLDMGISSSTVYEPWGEETPIENLSSWFFPLELIWLLGKKYIGRPAIGLNKKTLEDVKPEIVEHFVDGGFTSQQTKKALKIIPKEAIELRRKTMLQTHLKSLNR